MIPLRPLQLKRRKATPTPGPNMDFGRVLIVCQLDPQKLYSAAQIAGTAYDAKTQPEEYKAARIMILDFGKRHEIRLSPDNVDTDGHLINHSGERIKRGAMWTGMNWQDRLSDTQWNEACDIFERVTQLDKANRTNGHSNVKYYYNESQTEILQVPAPESHPLPSTTTDPQDVATPSEPTPDHLQANQPPPSTLKPQSSARHWRIRPLMPLLSAIALVLLVFGIQYTPNNPDQITALGATDGPSLQLVDTSRTMDTHFENRWRQKHAIKFPYLASPPNRETRFSKWTIDKGPHQLKPAEVCFLAFATNRAHQRALPLQSSYSERERVHLFEQSQW